MTRALVLVSIQRLASPAIQARLSSTNALRDQHLKKSLVKLRITARIFQDISFDFFSTNLFNTGKYKGENPITYILKGALSVLC